MKSEDVKLAGDGWPVKQSLYRRKKCDTEWHWIKDCSDYPDSNFVCAKAATCVNPKCSECMERTTPCRQRAYKAAVKKRGST